MSTTVIPRTQDWHRRERYGKQQQRNPFEIDVR